MKTTHLLASELSLVLLLTGCANLPMDQACSAGIEKNIRVLETNGHQLKYHRTLDFTVLLSAAEDDELDGDYQSCLRNLRMARINHHSGRVTVANGYNGIHNTSSWGGQQSNGGAGIDAAHHAAGHTHHHGHN